MELSGALCWKSTGFLNIGNQMEIMFPLTKKYFLAKTLVYVLSFILQRSRNCVCFSLCSIYDYFQI